MANFLFIDFETRGPDLKELGAYKYARDPRTSVLLLAYALDNEPVQVWEPPTDHPTGGLPRDVEHHIATGGYIVAWNAAFDRHIWQSCPNWIYDLIRPRTEQFLDAMAQAQASGLPGKLDRAGQVLKLGGKHEGKRHLQKFTSLDWVWPAYEEWDQFKEYAKRDVELMRKIWQRCRQLSIEEWQEYWASERINDKGIGIDVELCKAAMSYKDEDEAWTASEVMRLTDGAVPRQTMSLRLSRWVYDRLDDTLRQIMVAERDDDGEPKRLTLGRQTVVQLLDDCAQSDTPPADEVYELLELLLFGRASSAAKFQKMHDQSVAGRLHGSHVFCGAGQTGRYSSRGVQTHNLPREALANEAEIINMVLDRVPVEQLRAIAPVSKILSRLVRTAIIAP